MELSRTLAGLCVSAGRCWLLVHPESLDLTSNGALPSQRAHHQTRRRSFSWHMHARCVACLLCCLIYVRWTKFLFLVLPLSAEHRTPSASGAFRAAQDFRHMPSVSMAPCCAVLS